MLLVVICCYQLVFAVICCYHLVFVVISCYLLLSVVICCYPLLFVVISTIISTPAQLRSRVVDRFGSRLSPSRFGMPVGLDLPTYLLPFLS